MKSERLKVFINAFACEPYKGSEGGIGWNVVNKLAAYHDVHVLTRANNREVIESFYAENNHKPEHLTFHYYDLPRWAMFWKKKRRGYRLYYYLWLYCSYIAFRKIVKAGKFDIVHHLTFAQEAAPNLFVALNPGKAMTIWGPVGRCPAPKAIKRAMPWGVKLKEMVRSGVKIALEHLDIMRIMTEKRTDLLITYPQDKANVPFKRKRRGKLIFYPQTGINVADPEYRLPERVYPERGKRLLICSEFFHWKGCTLAAQAFVKLAAKYPDIELNILGSGPEEKAMRRIFEQGKVGEKVHFHGFVSKEEMMNIFNTSDLLLYPSYHHGLATVILQAMWAKLPIVALQGDFVAHAVAEGAGLCASGGNMDEIIRDIADKAEMILADADLRKQLGECGRTLILQKYSWDVMVDGMSRIYQRFASGEKFEDYQDLAAED